MTTHQFRRAAIAQPGAIESAHMDHPDFRVGGKIFATLGYPNDECGMVRLPSAIQAKLVKSAPAAFQPVKGAWGRQGATQVILKKAPVKLVRSAMRVAWRRASAGLTAVRRVQRERR
jgi:hypothetical protein